MLDEFLTNSVNRGQSLVDTYKSELACLALTDPERAIWEWRVMFGGKTRHILHDLSELSGRDLGKAYWVRCICNRRYILRVGPRDSKFESPTLKCCREGQEESD